MTSFVHVEQPQTHPGVERAQEVYERMRSVRRLFDGARGLAALLLSAIVSSVLVVADKLMSTWNEGGLLAAWVVLWAVAFAVIAFFAGTARTLAKRMVSTVRAAARRRAAARADEQFMAHAKLDARILRDLQAIATHQEADLVDAPVAPARSPSLELIARRSAEAQVPTLYQALRRTNLGQYY